MRRTVDSVLRFHINAWPFCRVRAKQLDQLQSAMVAKFVRLPPTPIESAADFHNRRSMYAARLIGGENRWGKIWADGTVSWYEHVLRHETMSAHQLLKFRSEDWLSTAISREFVERAVTSKTSTRARPGKPCVRFEAGIEDANRYLRS